MRSVQLLWSQVDVERAEMAGNIIPAIATTNAIVAGLIVLQCLKVLQKQMEDLRLVYVSRRSDKALSATKPPVPEPRCAICRTPYVKLAIHPKTLTMQTFVDEVVKKQVGYPGEVTVRDGRRIIFDPDADESGEKTFEELNISLSTMLEVDDEDTELISSVFVFSECVPSTSCPLYHTDLMCCSKTAKRRATMETRRRYVKAL